MKTPGRFFAFITLVFLFLPPAYAQLSRFNAGIVAGLNFAELEGDGITDYFGFNGGLIGTMKMTKHSQIGLELLYSQNGEYVLPAYYPALRYGQVQLHHIEIPLHIDWLIGVFQREKFYDWNLNLGVAYTRLLGYRALDIEKTDVTSQIIYNNREALLLQAGTTYNFTHKFGLNLKASLPLRVDGLSWTLAARLTYMFHGKV